LIIAVIRIFYHSWAMLEELRFFLVILEEGSLRRAAKRLHISQPALTRQMQLLEHDLGGRILERTSTGVHPTNVGHALAEKARALLGYYDSTMAEARRMVRGESERLRVGYLASAGQEYLGPALSALRRLHPEVKTKLLDLTTGEQIMALRRGEIDLALTYLGRDLLSRDFYTRKVATVPSLAALPIKHRLASQIQISISELKNEHFLRVPDTSAPGYNQKISQFCVQFGRFRPRFAAMRTFTSLAEGLSLSASEDEISLYPISISHLRIPNVVMVPIADTGASWDLFVAWQRGKTSGPLRALLDALTLKSGRSS
jgi:DNA-binding transcriptional LysR family regulator